ncbi:hypothetical protein D3233_15110 [Staphylococcus aureus]|uniref:hypothetical protein n=2 Tax=Bacillales TaxID=1385 RepID=UPI000445273C|nr:hypothetical protein [Staphylococcus aureus]EZT48005.1 hypothetical protein V056_02609 [Staphylococcus aureus MSSA-123]EZZ33204.1 hypothetical protein V115_02653 [Staphylococcus aureus Tur-12]EZT42227.1 hypothetical protein V054_02598 [Staphylococcus aureus MSSA-47]EZT45868.1 hypothetical protein V053_02521 [Staphylococcus aureus MSSA-37]EZV21395.1 hypothetical protein U928_02632 [Staphylococcus aureus 12S01153]
MYKTLELTDWIPVPFMAFVLTSVIGSQITKISNDFYNVIDVIPLYICFIILAPIIGSLSGKIFKLNAETRRTLAFSNGTRNSLVVLPLALSLPDEIVTIATAVIVTQTIIELIGELILIKIIPIVIKD